MRQFKRFCAATLLSLAIGITAFAGDVQAPAGADPQPPGEIGVPVATSPVPGDVSTLEIGSATDTFTEFTVELYVLFLSMF